MRVNKQFIRSTLKNASLDPSADLQERVHVNKKSEKAERERKKAESKVRLGLINPIFTVTVMWMFFILMIIVACGKGDLKLSDTILVTLITTTTANVFGFMYIVTKYLYNDKILEN